MSQKEIRLYDDSVIKLTVKQGLEDERFPVSSVSDGGVGTYNKNEINILDFDQVSTISGSFATGEVAYTRDTNRLFVGNLSKKLADKQQQTLGGTLTGNKYLGYLDSRKDYNSEDNGDPIPLTEILGEDSIYRSYNFTNLDEEGQIKQTEDKKWQRLSFYNEKYDAYDGDIMYDIYRNAIILFDHNIKPQDGTTAGSATIGGKRKTPLQARFQGENVANVAEKLIVNKHTADMYGDGYVLLYNVIPDGDTLTFVPRSFSATGEYENANDTTPNYSQNVIKVNKVPAPAMMAALDTNVFKFTEDSEKITVDLSGITGSDITGISLENPSLSRLIINEEGVLKQSKIAPSALANFITAEDLKNMEISKQVDANTAEITTLTSKVEALENQSGGDGGNTSEIDGEFLLMVPDYATSSKNLLEDNLSEEDSQEIEISTSDAGETTVIFHENYITDEDNGNITYHHYFLNIAGTGEFTFQETYLDDYSVQDSSGQWTTIENYEFGKDIILKFGSAEKYEVTTSTNTKITIPVYTDIMLPINGRSTIKIIGKGLSKIVKIPTR